MYQHLSPSGHTPSGLAVKALLSVPHQTHCHTLLTGLLSPRPSTSTGHQHALFKRESDSVSRLVQQLPALVGMKSQIHPPWNPQELALAASPANPFLSCSQHLPPAILVFAVPPKHQTRSILEPGTFPWTQAGAPSHHSRLRPESTQQQGLLWPLCLNCTPSFFSPLLCFCFSHGPYYDLHYSNIDFC